MPKASAELSDVVQALGQVDIRAARAADAQRGAAQELQWAERQREEAATASIHSAVRDAIDSQWDRLSREARRSLAPPHLPMSAMLDPVGAASHAAAAHAIPSTAPGELVETVSQALLSIPEGQAVRRHLAETGQRYREQDHPDFHRILQDLTGAEVGNMLQSLDRRLRAHAQATVANAAARDAAVQAQRAGAEHAAMAQDTQRVQANARQPTATIAGAVPPVHSTGPAIPARAARNAGREDRETLARLDSLPPAPTEDPPGSRLGVLRERLEQSILDTMPSVPAGALPSVAELEQRLANLRGTAEALASSLPSVPSERPDRLAGMAPIEEGQG